MGVSGQSSHQASPSSPLKRPPARIKQARAGSACALGRRGRQMSAMSVLSPRWLAGLIASFWRANEGRNVGLAGELISHSSKRWAFQALFGACARHQTPGGGARDFASEP